MTEKNKEKQNDAELVNENGAPFVFVSHDTRDAELAEVFGKLLSNVSAGVLKSFRSSDKKGKHGIEYGSEWYPNLMKNLNKASDVVCLLTPRSIGRPWILYEAGVAKGKLNTPVYGVALGISLDKVISGPFAQFQNSDDDEEALTGLVMQLLKRIPNSEPDTDVVKMQVKEFKIKAKDIYKKLGEDKGENTTKTIDDTSVVKIFEEVKLMFQDLPSRVESRMSNTMEPNRRKRMKRFHPMMIEDLMHMSGKVNGAAVLPIIFSFYRDEMPWLYDMGIDLYRVIKTGTRDEIMNETHSFMSTIEFIKHSPLGEEMMDSKEAYMILRELPRILDMIKYEPKHKR